MSLGEAVLAIQNSQREVPTGFFCGGAPVFFPGRNPLSPLLMSVASSIVGLALTNPLKQYTSANSIHFCGQSPVFSGVDVSRPSFSVLDMVISYFLESIYLLNFIFNLCFKLGCCQPQQISSLNCIKRVDRSIKMGINSAI